MNWFSHWDEDFEDEDFPKEKVITLTNENKDYFKIPTEEEINELFGCE